MVSQKKKYSSIIHFHHLLCLNHICLGACLKTHIASISHQIRSVLSNKRYALLNKDSVWGIVNKNYRSFRYVFIYLYSFLVFVCLEEKKYQIKFLLNKTKKNSKQIGVACTKDKFYEAGHGTYYVDIIMLRHASRIRKSLR